ncbi:MAG: hypothetical protein V4515_10395 [Chloroflexota bacterium]
MSLDPSAPVDLPVLWWVFWLAVMSVGVFVAFAWWLTREALREDAAPAAEHEHRRPGGPRDESDEDGSARSVTGHPPPSDPRP